MKAIPRLKKDLKSQSLSGWEALPYLTRDLNAKKGLWPDAVISELLFFAKSVGRNLTLKEKIAYIISVMQEIYQIAHDYEVATEIGYKLRSSPLTNSVGQFPQWDRQIEEIVERVGYIDRIWYLLFFELVIKNQVAGKRWNFEIYNDFVDSYKNKKSRVKGGNELKRMLKILKGKRAGVGQVVRLLTRLREFEHQALKLHPFTLIDLRETLLLYMQKEIEKHQYEFLISPPYCPRLEFFWPKFRSLSEINFLVSHIGEEISASPRQ